MFADVYLDYMGLLFPSWDLVGRELSEKIQRGFGAAEREIDRSEGGVWKRYQGHETTWKAHQRKIIIRSFAKKTSFCSSKHLVVFEQTRQLQLSHLTCCMKVSMQLSASSLESNSSGLLKHNQR